MPTPGQHFKLVRELAQHTRLGNVKWDEVDQPNAFIWSAGESAVLIRSLNGTREYPVELSVWRIGEAEPVSSWITEAESPPGEESWDEHVREIWATVAGVTDPVTELLRELEDMPPF